MADIITTLHPENDADTNLYPNIVKENIPDGAIDMFKLNDDVKSLLNQSHEVNPSGVDTSTNIVAKTEDDGIWVSSTNGHWYYWNGTQYIDSGMAYIQSIISNNKLMNLALDGYIEINETNKTITIKGNIIFAKSNYCVVSNVSVRSISYDGLASNTYYCYIRSNVLYFATINTECQANDIIIWIGYIENNVINTEVFNVNNKKPFYALDFTGSITIDTTNKNLVITSGYAWWSNDYGLLPSGTISYASILDTSCILIFRNNNYVVYNIRNYREKIRIGDIILAIIWFDSVGNVNQIIYMAGKLNNDIALLNSRVTALESTEPKLPVSSKILMRVGCIGDSYTSGWILDEAYKNNPNFSWCKYMKQLTGNEWSNFGESGSSTKSWITGTLGKLSQVQASGNKCQAYVIGLMINDCYIGSPTYVALGTSADIGTDADSYYAYYYKLINACLTVNPNAKIICNTCPKTGGSFASYNQAVVDIVAYCQNENKDVFLNDLRNYDWSNTTFTSDALNGHYTAIGYEYMAEIMNIAISKVINDNLSHFQNINLVDYDNV